MTKHFVIGFTGTIASGKTVRCHRLLQIAIKHQLDTLRPTPECGKETILSVEEALQMASPTILDGKKSTSLSTSYLSLLRGSPLSVKYINADLLGHTVYLPGATCYHQLVQHFGEGILAQDGNGKTATSDNNSPRRHDNAVRPCTGESLSVPSPCINRRVLGDIVFADPRQLSVLNDICRPHIMEAFQTQYSYCVLAAQEAGKQAILLILEAALLLEMPGMLRCCTDVWITSCSKEVAASRLAQRNGFGSTETMRRIVAQANLSENLKTFCRVGFTGGMEHFDTSKTTLEEGLQQVDVTFENYWRDKIKPYL